MARRKKKKNTPNASLPSQSKKTVSNIGAHTESSLDIKIPKQEIRNSINKSGTKAKGKISIPTCLAGMFLTLILGIYLGTLLPETIQHLDKRTVVKNEVDKPASPQASTQIPSSVLQNNENQTNNAAPDSSQLMRQLAAMEKTVQTDPSADNWISLGNLYFDTEQPQNAIHAYEHSLKINPNNADVLTDMGIMYREIKQPNKALECFRNASSIDSRHVNALFNEGVVLAYDLGDKSDAIKAWKKLLAINPDARSPTGIPVAKMIEELH